jgi:prophage regulatory protein
MSQLKILRISDVISRTGLSRSTIYLRIAQGTFPAQVKLGERSVGWSSQAVDEWIMQRITAAHPGAAA